MMDSVIGVIMWKIVNNIINSHTFSDENRYNFLLSRAKVYKGIKWERKDY